MTTNVVTAEVEVGQRPVQVAFSPDGRFAYAAPPRAARIDLRLGDDSDHMDDMDM